MTSLRTMPSPLGELVLVADATALTAVHLPGPHVPSGTSDIDHPVLAQAVAELTAYFAGARTFTVPCRAEGTAFQHQVWRALSDIPFGELRSYVDIARAIARPSASRAVGAANGRNPLAIIVPCHRVIGANGTLTGYAGGLAAKQWLLAHERRDRQLSF
jgi:methylated-DNA-[protein]-cysteine S-methyltransferase